MITEVKVIAESAQINLPALGLMLPVLAGLLGKFKADKTSAGIGKGIFMDKNFFIATSNPNLPKNHVQDGKSVQEFLEMFFPIKEIPNSDKVKMELRKDGKTGEPVATVEVNKKYLDIIDEPVPEGETNQTTS